MSSSEKPTRVLYYDALNVVASFGVVAMHFNGLVHAYSPTWAWRQALAVDCLFYWAVPIFFMLTGATLMEYRSKYDTRTFVKKRLVRVLVPFLAWSLIALVWKVLTGQMDAPVGPRSLINLVFNTQIIDIYWFFIPLFAVYLCLPVLSLLCGQRRVLWYAAFGAIALNIALPSLFAFVGIPWNAYAGFPALGGFLVYVLLGYLLKGQELSKRTRATLYLLGIGATVLRWTHTVVASGAAGTLVTQTWGYLNLPCLLQGVAVFVFARQARWERTLSTERAQRTLATIASCSFGIYLTHMIVFWYGLQLTGLDGSRLLWRLAGPVITYALCLAITWSAKRVPFLRRLFP